MSPWRASAGFFVVAGVRQQLVEDSVRGERPAVRRARSRSASRPPGRRTRRISRSAFARFGTSWSTNDDIATSIGRIVVGELGRGRRPRLAVAPRPSLRPLLGHRRSGPPASPTSVDPGHPHVAASARARRASGCPSRRRRRARRRPVPPARAPSRSSNAAALGRQDRRPPALVARRASGRSARSGRSSPRWCHVTSHRRRSSSKVPGVVLPDDRPPPRPPMDRTHARRLLAVALAHRDRRRGAPRRTRPRHQRPARRRARARRPPGCCGAAVARPIRSMPGCRSPPLVLAGFVAIRADPFLACSTCSAPRCSRCLDGRVLGSRGHPPLGVGRAGDGCLGAGGHAGRDAVARCGRARPPRGDGPDALPVWLGAVGRGLLLAVPLVLIFAILFASADPIFRRAMDDLLGLRIDLGDLPGRLLFAVAVAWFAGGLLASRCRGIPDVEPGVARRGRARRRSAAGTSRSLGPTEALIVLLASTSWSACSSASRSPTCSAASTRWPRPA